MGLMLVIKTAHEASTSRTLPRTVVHTQTHINHEPGTPSSKNDYDSRQ